jgi:hypothetical protein
MPVVLVITTAVRLLPGNVPDGPVAGAVKVTETPPTAFPDESVTLASIGTAKGLATWVLCGDPAAVPTRAATPYVLVRRKGADATPNGREAVTVYDPARMFAVNTPEVALPVLSVVAAEPPAANVPLAPDVGADQVMSTPFAGLPAASLARA